MEDIDETLTLLKELFKVCKSLPYKDAQEDLRDLKSMWIM